MPRNRILIVDDEENIGRSLRLILERAGYAVTCCQSIAAGRVHPDTPRADVLLLDVRLPDGNGIELLRELRAAGNAAPAVMISGNATIAEAVEATRAGAFDFLEKPLGRDRVLLAVKNALEQATLRQENERLREMIGPASRMIGPSAAFQRAVEQAASGGPLRRPRAADRRVGDGEGIARGAHSPIQPVLLGPVRQGELRRDPDGAARKRTVRPRERGVHRRGRHCAAASSSWPMAGPSFSTRSAICIPLLRPNSCECSRKASSTAWEASRPCGSRFALSRRPTRTWLPW